MCDGFFDGGCCWLGLDRWVVRYNGRKKKFRWRERDGVGRELAEIDGEVIRDAFIIHLCASYYIAFASRFFFYFS